LLRALTDACQPGVLVGCSSAGEFVSGDRGEGSASAVGLRSNVMQFHAGLGRNLRADRGTAAADIAKSFRGLTSHQYPHRAALVLSDALAGYTDDFIEQLSVATLGNYRFFGGGAGDDGRFQKTHVFAGTQAVTDAVVALEILSARPLGVGVSHGWEPAGEGMRVTEVAGTRLTSLNGIPAADAIADHAAQTGQEFDRANPMPFFLHNILGIRDDKHNRLREPLAVHEDGAISLAAEVPPGAVVHLMKTTDHSAVLAAERATLAAIAALDGGKPQAALVFDCVATRLRLGRAFQDELRMCAEMLHPAAFVGCNTYGQIARAEGQFGGFHNCTAVVCVLPE
jgi:hypothetical protein